MESDDILVGLKRWDEMVLSTLFDMYYERLFGTNIHGTLNLYFSCVQNLRIL